MQIKYYLFVIFSFLASLHIQAQSLVVSQSFDATAFAPAGWLIQPDQGNQNIWVRRTSGTNGTQNVCLPHSGAGLARFTSRTESAGTTQLLVTDIVDYSNRGTNAAVIDFWMFRDSLIASNPDSLSIYINTTDTLNSSAVKLGTIARNRSISLPDTQSVNGWYHYTFNVPASFTSNTNYFIFEGRAETQNAGSGANIFIDDVSYDTYPPLCAGIPNVGNILSNTVLICNGSGSANLNLTAPITTLGVSYDWQSSSSSTGPFTSMGITNTNANTGTLSTTTYYQCVVTCSYSGQNYTTPVFTVTVSNNPTPTVSISSSSNPICNGDTAQLIASGAATYQWGPSTTLSAITGDTVYAFPTTSSQYTLTGTDAAGCSASTTLNLTVSNGPNVSISATPNDTVCAGQQVILNSIPGGNAGTNTYLWSDGVTTRRDTILANTTTVYSVIVTNQAGCSNTDTITIVVNPATIGNFGFTRNFNTFNFQDSTLGAVSWFWDFGDGNMSSNQNPVYTYSAPGIYTVTLIVEGPCGSDTVTQTIQLWPESISDIKESNWLVFPNPATDRMVIKSQSNTQSIQYFSLKDMQGRVIMVQKDILVSEISIDISSLPNGLYWIETNLGVQKIVKSPQF